MLNQKRVFFWPSKNLYRQCGCISTSQYYHIHTRYLCTIFNFVHIIMVSFTSEVFSLLDEYFRSLKSAKSIYHSLQAIRPMSGCIAYLMIKHLSKSPTAYQEGKHNGWFWGLLSKKYFTQILILPTSSTYTVKKIDHSLKHVKTNLTFFGLSQSFCSRFQNNLTEAELKNKN